MSDPPGTGATSGADSRESSGEGAALERDKGLAVEVCYRHPKEITGVHCTRCGRPICTDCMRPAAVGYQCPDCAGPGGRVATRRRASITVGGAGRITRLLLAVNVAMFAVELAVGGPNSLLGGPDCGQIIRLGASQPILIAVNHEYWRLFTAMFLHAGILHLGLNMYALYLFGSVVEDAYGSGRFLALYVTSGLLASVASFVFGPPGLVGVGASGAIFGLLGAWFAYNYRRRAMRFHRANLQGAVSLIVLNLVLSAGLSSIIDWRAHVGGLVAGVILGFTAEGLGPPSVRPLVRLGGFVGLLILGAILTVAHVNQLTSTFGPVVFRC
jgi:membrane associated rhomboid family serine protease